MFPLKTWIKSLVVGVLFVGLLTGCQLFRRSELAGAVDQTRVSGQRGQSLTALHRLLSARGVEHKVVQFRYDVSARPLVAPLGDAGFSILTTPLSWLPTRPQPRERTGIIYRDDSDRREPWWYVDHEVSRAIWLPTDTVERQLTFAMKRRVELLRVQEFDRAISGMTKENEPSNNQWNERFRQMHGTDFNPQSAVDLAKMRALKTF